MANRVTSGMMYGSLFNNMQNNMARMLDLQEQMTTQKKYFRPSDNPISVARGVGLSTSLFENEQYIKNQEDAVSWLKASDTAFSQMLKSAQRLRELTIYAGDGTLGPDELKAISAEIQELKEELRNTANTSIAGKYLFSGLDTSTKPFSYDAFGRIVYGGSSKNLNFEIERSVISQISFNGKEVFPSNEKTYNVKSQYVPMDWSWKGREEKVQIRLGDTIVKVQIPEMWIDEVATGSTKPSDFNQFRDPDEVRGLTMDQVAELFNRSLKDGGADKLIGVKVEKDAVNGIQRLVFTSNTGEPIQITGWPDTDMAPMEQSLAGLKLDPADMPNWKSNTLIGSLKPEFNAPLAAGTLFQISVGGGPLLNVTTTAASNNIADLVTNLNAAGVLPAGVKARESDGRLVLEAAGGETLRVDGGSSSAIFGSSKSSVIPNVKGLMGEVNTLGWTPDKTGKVINITLDGTAHTFNLDDYSNSTELVKAINEKLPPVTGAPDVASLVNGRIVLRATNDISVAGNGTEQIFGVDTAVTPITGTASSLTFRVGDAQPIQIFINENDSLDKIAAKVEAVTGMSARMSADGKQIVVVAKRDRPLPDDMLSSNDAAEALAYPKFTMNGTGAALQLFNFQVTQNTTTGILEGVTASQEVRRPNDHSHIDLLDYLGMETTLKSTEFQAGQTLKVGANGLHWRVMSGNNQVDLKLPEGTYTMEQIAERLRNAGLGWLEVTVDMFNTNGQNLDSTENGLGTSNNFEPATSRLVIKAIQNAPVTFLDVNGAGYASEMGLSTAIRTDNNARDVVFPTAACLDSKTPAYMKVVVGDGKTYTVKLNQKDVVDPLTGFVDRNKVMNQIAKQVNEQSGTELMRVMKDAAGKESSIFAATGEPVMISDLPVPDSEWNSYSMGIAMQMGIHSGVTAAPRVKDDDNPANPGTIRIRALGRSIDIDVTTTDTVKSIMDKIRDQAGTWLEVNYFDPKMGQAGAAAGDEVMFAISAKDGSPVSIYDLSGDTAQTFLAADNSVNGTVNLTVPANWPAFADDDVLKINVAGYSHTIDLFAMQKSALDKNGACTPQDLIDQINARFQDEDIRAELNEDGLMVLYSPRGYKIEVDCSGANPPNRATDIFGADVQVLAGTGPADKPAASSLPLRAGETSSFTINGATITLGANDGLNEINRQLEAAFPAAPSITAGFSSEGYLMFKASPATPITVADAGGTVDLIGTTSLVATNAQRGGAPQGINSQLNTVRSGPNTSQANFFDVIDNLSSTMEAENRKALSNFLLPQIDSFIDNLLKCRASEGALQNRYTSNISRFKTNEINLTEVYDSVVGVDLSKAATEFAMLKSMYDASLAVISQIVQPTLVDFLR